MGDTDARFGPRKRANDPRQLRTRIAVRHELLQVAKMLRAKVAKMLRAKAKRRTVDELSLTAVFDDGVLAGLADAADRIEARAKRISV